MIENKDDIGVFLTDYAAKMLECGATTARIEKNVLRMAEAYGFRSAVNIFPLHVEVVLSDGDSKGRDIVDDHNPGAEREQIKTAASADAVIRTKAIRDSNINYNTISELSKLSWNCFDCRLSLEETRQRYQKIVSATRIPFGVVTLLTACANLSFCRLFGGDFAAMGVVFVATLCGFYVKGELCRKWHIDSRLAIIIASLLSAIISCSCYVYSWGETPDIALATSVLYLVPGIPYLNAVSDLIGGHYICAMSRLVHALVITVCLGMGLYLALLLMNAQMI